MRAVRIEELPKEVLSRVLAATGNASHRRARQMSDEADPTYAIEAVSGDRVTLMVVGLRPDGSVEEVTDSFTARDIHDLDTVAGEVTVRGPEGTRVLSVAPDTAEAIRALRT